MFLAHDDRPLEADLPCKELCICFESKPEKQGKAVKSQNTAQAEAVYLLMLDETSVPSSLYKGVDSGSGFLT